LWATLVLRFDADHRADVVTTIDPCRMTLAGDREAIAAEVVSWVEATHGRCPVGVFTDLEGPRAFLAAADKGAALTGIAARGVLIANRLPAGLAAAIAGA
jgi:hypothetical protein